MLDYLIVGHGLAGAVLSFMFEERGRSIMIIDNPDKNSSSNVAGGLYNPITGRKMLRTWKADSIFPQIEPFYTKFERHLSIKVLNKIGIYRPFYSVEEQNDWQGKISEPKYSSFIKEIRTSPYHDQNICDPHGGIHLHMAGWVNVKELINGNKKYLSGKGRYVETVFNNHLLTEKTGHFEYGEWKFKRLVFCTGLGSTNDPFFTWLPFKPVKGELLTIKLENQISTIYNRGIFMVPLDDHQCRVGATYDWKNLNSETSEDGKRELNDKLRTLYEGSYEIVDQNAGIRPATKDRRPFIGMHPVLRNTYIFNGFGSKGVSLMPYFGKQFVEFLEDDKPLEKEVNISRYFSLYYTKEDQSNG